MKRIGAAPGSPEPADVFEPYLPAVDVVEDADALFARAREQSERGAKGDGHREVVIITPGRMLMGMPTAAPGSMPESFAQPARTMLGTRPLTVTAIVYNNVKALLDDPERKKVIPFLGHLLGFAYTGHRVVCFEGHPTAFEAGVRGTDVLIIDSAMLPFLQEDWAVVAFRVMNGGCRIFVHNRKPYGLYPVARIDRAPGWRFTENDGEASYTNCLLTVLAQSPVRSVQLVAGAPVPALAPLAPDDDDEREWISVLPFRFDRLDAEKVMAGILRNAKKEKAGLFRSALVMRAKLAKKGGAFDVAFRLTEGREGGRRTLRVERM